MNKAVLNKYGISFIKQANGNIKTRAISPILDIYIYMFSRYKPEIQDFIASLELALNGQYAAIDYDKREWHKEVGKDLYTGIIQQDLTFELFQEDHYDETLETFPLLDIKEIFNSLLEFLN